MKKYFLISFLLCTIFTIPVNANPSRENNSKGLKKLETLKIWKLVEYMELTDEQADKFLPRYRNFGKDLKTLNKKKLSIIRSLVKDIKDNNIGNVKSQINQVTEYEKETINRKDIFLKDISNILSDEQMAKFVVYEYKFREEVKRILEERKARKFPRK
ncbi:hypothetical protein KAU43_07265 [candidate division WOR-3 bacterium]|nr:hypothetical protein [candidate division WOR-3 bacterium]